MKHALVVAAVIGASAGFVACGGDSATAGTDAVAGDTIRFSYSGNATGTFDVRQSPPGSGSASCGVPLGAETWACAYVHGSGDYWILGTSAVNDSISTKIWIVLDPVTAPGTLARDPSCTSNCADIVDVIVNINVRRNCCSTGGGTIQTGTVTIQSIGGGRIRGTFAGNGVGQIGNVTISGGYFSLRLRGS